MDDGFVAAPDGVRLAVRLLGEGTPALIVPGTGGDADLLPLADGRRVAFYDVRNRGRSDAVGAHGVVGIPVEVEDVDVVRTAVGFERVSLFGWSYVGLVAALYAAAHGEHLERLVMVCPAAPTHALQGEPAAPDADVLERIAALTATDLARSDPVRFAREWRGIVTPSRMGDPDAFARLRSDPSVWPNEWPDHMTDALARVGASLPDAFDYREQAGMIRAPTLVVHGEVDTIPVASSRAWATAIPDARLLVLPGVGHFPHVESPHAFFAAVETFLGGAWPDQAVPLAG